MDYSLTDALIFSHLGAGIIGVCTAYYLTKHPAFSKETHHITILEARRPAGAASGKAGGLLAMWAFPQQIVPLSFKLHEELAEEYNGSTEWGYRGLKTLCIEGNISSSHLRNIRNGNVKANADIDLPEDLDWVSPEIIDGWTHLGDGESTAQVQPYKFTLFILKKVLETGAVDLITGKVVEVTSDKDGKANGVVYTTTHDKIRYHHNSILYDRQQQQPAPQKETSTQSSTKSGIPPSPKKQQVRSSLHHPDNPTFKSDVSMLPLSGNKHTLNSSTEDSINLASVNTFRSIHNTSYTASTNSAPSISESSEDSLNLSTDDESILDGSVASSEESTSGLEIDYAELESTEKPIDPIKSNGLSDVNESNDSPGHASKQPFTTSEDTSSTNSTTPSKDTTENKPEPADDVADDASSTNEKQDDGTSEDKPTEKVKHYLTGDQVVLTLGPWTSKLLPSCPISGLRAHSITIQPSKQVSPFALFTEMRTSRASYVSPEIYPRRDEVYVCGEGDTFADVPETSDDVEVLRDRCDELFKHVSAVSPNLKNGRILKRQACYLPVVDVPSHSGPFIGCTNVDNLYLASGHSCWGINNAPATGLLMSEILLDGEALSASVDGLEPEFYFDASPQQ